MAKIAWVLAEKLRHYRHLRGLSQIELADRAGVSRRTVTLYEASKGSGSFDVVAKLAKVLEVEESDLVHVEAPPKPITIRPTLREMADAVARAVRDIPEGVHVFSTDDPTKKNNDEK